MNTYSYANLNPLLFTDPKGLDGSLEPPRPLGPQGPSSSPNYQKDPICLAITCAPDGYYYPSDFPGDQKCLKDCFKGEKPTQENVERIIQEILKSNPEISFDRNGNQILRDLGTGRAVRLDPSGQIFDTLLGK